MMGVRVSGSGGMEGCRDGVEGDVFAFHELAKGWIIGDSEGCGLLDLEGEVEVANFPCEEGCGGGVVREGDFQKRLGL